MYIGIDLGGTNIAVGLVNEDGKIIHKDSVPTLANRPYQEIIKDMGMLVNKVIKDGGATVDGIKSVGIGSPGTCDNKNGVIVYANNINFFNTPMREELQKYIDKPIYMENDANVAALAEYFILNKEMQCFIFITLGTGVGGGIIINGKIFSGFNGAGAELGHTVITEDGEPCTCGRNGCWEAYASVTALIRQTKKSMAENPDSLMHTVAAEEGKISGKTAFIAAKKGDEAGLKVVKAYAKHVSVGIANMINIFQPEMLVIGGGISKEGDYLLNPIKEFCNGQTYDKGGIPTTKISIAQLGNDAGIIGAAFLGK